MAYTPYTQDESQDAAAYWNAIHNNDPNASKDAANGKYGEFGKNQYKQDTTGEGRSEFGGNTHFDNPGAAEYGGGKDGEGVAYYSGLAEAGKHENDAQQASNDAAMHSSLANMKGNRGPQSVENRELSGRANATRGQQIDALGMARSAALGNAPSAAAFQTKQAMNGIMGQFAGTSGSARGLSALGAAQTGSAAMAGGAAGDIAAQGGMARSKEIGDAVGMYGSMSNQVRGQDLTRLGTSDQNNQFNAQSNDNWKLGNANLAASQAGLGVSQGNTDMAWTQAQMAPEDKQFQYDQEMAAEQAGADADKSGAQIQASRESRNNTRDNINGGITAGLGAIGSFAGPVGTAAGAGLGGAIASATKKYW